MDTAKTAINKFLILMIFGFRLIKIQNNIHRAEMFMLALTVRDFQK